MSTNDVLLTGFAGLVAGALSMGAGEYVSVSSQADTERADLGIERRALQHDYVAEHEELRDIYILRGLNHELATEVSLQLMAHDALGAHARDDIGMTDALMARPIQAAVTSAVSFVLGGFGPLLGAFLSPRAMMIPLVAGISLIFLSALGSFAAYVGGASTFRAAARVVIWGLLR